MNEVCSGPWGGSGQEFDCLQQDVGTASAAAAAAAAAAARRGSLDGSTASLCHLIFLIW